VTRALAKRWAVAALAIIAATGCARARERGFPGEGDAAVSAPDARTTADARPVIDAAILRDAQPLSDAATGTPDAAPMPDAAPPDAAPSGLDPALELPDPSGEACATPGSMSECPGIQVCRFYDEEYGRCESCTDCGNLNAYCTASEQCDILFSCYAHACTNFCTLGTQACGPVEDCLDVGHPTQGVCRP